jgi:hypothetical protein
VETLVDVCRNRTTKWGEFRNVRDLFIEAYLEQADALGRERYLKSGAGRRFLRSQFKNYLRKHPRKKAA